MNEVIGVLAFLLGLGVVLVAFHLGRVYERVNQRRLRTAKKTHD